MGNKVNPNTFRACISKKYLSNWYAEKLQYSKLLKEDFFLRKLINKILNKYTIIGSVKITRVNNKLNFNNTINVIISSLIFEKKQIFNTIFFNSQLGKKYYSYIYNVSKKKKITIIDESIEDILILKFFKNISIIIKKLFQKKFSNKIKIKFDFINDFYEDIHLMALYICMQIKKKVNCKRILASIIENLPENILGIRIQICGRHTGAQRTSLEKLTYGKVQLNTLVCDLEYVQQENKTRDGAFGVKLWISKNWNI